MKPGLAGIRSMSGTVLSLVLAAVVAAAPASGQATDPRQVAEAFFEAVAAERWREAAGFLDLESFDVYRQALIASARNTRPERRLTVEEMMRWQPDMPRAVAEYHIKQIDEVGKDSARWLKLEFAGIDGVDALAAMTPIDAASRWIEAQDFRYQMRVASKEAAGRGCPETSAVLIPDMSRPNHILGVVVTDSVAYTLHIDPRMSPQSSDEAVPVAEAKRRAAAASTREWFGVNPSVMQLRRIKGNWLIFGGQGLLNSGTVASVECEEPR